VVGVSYYGGPAFVATVATVATAGVTAVRALPERQRQASLLPLLHNYQRPETPIRGSIAPTDRFRSAVQDAKINPDKDIPHVTPTVIVKYITDLQLLGLL
jgi:fatty acid CoA ligase FadD9